MTYPQMSEPKPTRIEVKTKAGLVDSQGRKAARLLGLAESDVSAGKVYYLGGDMPQDEARRVAAEFLSDPIAEEFAVGELAAGEAVEIGYRPGVTDNEGHVASEVLSEALGRPLAVHSARVYRFRAACGTAFLDAACSKLGNPLVERFRSPADPSWGFDVGVAGPVGETVLGGLVTQVDLPDDDAALEAISREGLLALSVAEMRAVREYFSRPAVVARRTSAGLPARGATDLELEAIAQTWSEHCKHKLFNDRIRYRDAAGERVIEDGLFRTFIRGATEEIRKERDWLVSVFSDNAGVIRFDDDHHLVFKVETHNSPSALEPYGGALTGIVGVNRDPAGTGLGCRLLFNTDVFCFGPPAWPHALPAGVLHPARIMAGVRKGVEDGGNQSGIPTVNGAVYFEPRFVGRPLVFCGTGGLMPREIAGRPAHRKEINPGDLAVMVGGRVGRDGIHGATFSSQGVAADTPASVVQIGDPITQKRALDLVAEAGERGLFRALTDNGAGGLSSSVGELAQLSGGCEIHLDRVPQKAVGLKPWEILVSESQERMTLAVPPERWEDLAALAARRGVEVSAVGVFTASGRFECTWRGQLIASLDLDWLHESGLPRRTLEAEWPGVDPGSIGAGVVDPRSGGAGVVDPGSGGAGVVDPGSSGAGVVDPGSSGAGVVDPGSSGAGVPAGLMPGEQAISGDATQALLALLASLNICSREGLVRQYDHEVQGGSVVKPLVGRKADGPGDAAVLRPLLAAERAVAVSCGLAPRYGDLDPYWMAGCAVDEALRNAVSVGADPDHLAILDNFCWPDAVYDPQRNPDGKRKLGALVRACEGLRDAAVAFGSPLISGKDSVKNDFHGSRPAGDLGLAPAPLGPGSAPDALKLSIAPTLLISAIGVVPDARSAVTMDFKVAGDLVYVVGATRDERGGSEWARLAGRPGGRVPTVDFAAARRAYAAVHRAICEHLVASCHDVSEGGLAVALAESALAGELGFAGDLAEAPGCKDLPPEAVLFSESAGRLVISIAPGDRERFEALLSDIPAACVGRTVAEPTVRLAVDGTTLAQASVADMKRAWQETPQW
ncbi:MAG: phosphoribosylformylglycinamidine synthase [Candidatus Sericytochromatia bacterium]|nr:phosphoribosylformylglycinamidine synthase [Candidatus Tanganyikabacteria bacterium]